MSSGDAAFSVLYADVYDLLHEDKPYQAEVQLVLDEAAALGITPRNVIDLACGTGRHLAEMSRRGLYVHGNDISPSMIALAARRLRAADPTRFRLTTEPMQTVMARPPNGEGFDLATIYYTAMGYVVSPEELHRLFCNLGRLVAPGGLLYADVWSAQKMVREFSPRRERCAENAKWMVRRMSDVTHVPEANALRVAFGIGVTNKETGETRQFDESHLVRYYSVPEVTNLLLAHGFRPLVMRPFFEQAERIEDAWNFYFIARREVTSE